MAELSALGPHPCSAGAALTARLARAPQLEGSVWTRFVCLPKASSGVFTPSLLQFGVVLRTWFASLPNGTTGSQLQPGPHLLASAALKASPLVSFTC